MVKIYAVLCAILCVTSIVFPFITVTVIKNEQSTEITTERITAADIMTTDKNTVRVFKTDNSSTVSVDMFDYLVGAVSGEMPASFSTEALKAQTIVCYTYALWTMEKERQNTDSEYDITDSSSLHQCYLNEEQQKEKWGEDYEENRKIIEDAVKSVYGEYLSYEGKPAMSVFHALSGGYTMSAEDVWGDEVPYLIDVEAPGDELSSDFEATVKISCDEFRKLFEENSDTTFESDKPTAWAKVLEKTEGGYINKLKVGTDTFTARDVKKILDFPGISFKGALKDNTYIFKVYGRGHGVGMSQYSADYMARQGSSYKEILAHFYPGTEIKNNDLQM